MKARKLMEQIAATPLTDTQASLLAAMEAFSGEDLVYERGAAYFGCRRIAARTVFALIRKSAITREDGEVGDFERYRLNDSGREQLAAYWGANQP